MRRICLCFFVVTLCIFLVACGSGVVRNVQIHIERDISDRFTEEEIRLAMEAVIEHFSNSNDGASELVLLRYNGSPSAREFDVFVFGMGNDDDDVIFISSQLYVGWRFFDERHLTHMVWRVSRANPDGVWKVVSWGKG